METRTISETDLARLLPRMQDISNKWRVDTELLVSLFGGYFDYAKRRNIAYKTLVGNKLDTGLEININLLVFERPELDRELVRAFQRFPKDPEKAEEAARKFSDYKTSEKYLFFECSKLAHTLMSYYLSVDIDKDRYPKIFAERERSRKLLDNPIPDMNEAGEWPQPFEVDEFFREQNLDQLSNSLIVAALSICRAQRCSDILSNSMIDKVCTIPVDEARKFYWGIEDTEHKICFFLSEVAKQCGGNEESLRDIYKLLEGI